VNESAHTMLESRRGDHCGTLRVRFAGTMSAVDDGLNVLHCRLDLLGVEHITEVNFYREPPNACGRGPAPHARTDIREPEYVEHLHHASTDEATRTSNQHATEFRHFDRC
jgi:hypothetical protein